LPVYIEENMDTNYEKILEVLKYLMYDIEIPFEKIDFKNRYNPNLIKIKNKNKNKIITINKNKNINNYIELGDIKSIFLNLLELYNIRISLKISYEKARKIIAEKKIKSKEDYYKLCEIDNKLSKEPEIVFKGYFTSWIEYLSIERVYYDLETCKNKISDYLLYPEIKKKYLNLSLISQELCKIDSLFPPDDLWIDYYNVKDLDNIIFIINKKKKKGSML
jgi:hypothetical protein